MKIVSRGLVIALILLGCVGCDQTSKLLVRAYLPLGQVYHVVGELVQLQRTENTGAFLSLGASWSRELQEAVFDGGVAVAVIGLLLWAVRGARLSPIQRIALAAIAAGGVGNLYDRLFHDGRVTDFLFVGLGAVHTGIFNVADVTLMVGLVLFLWPRRRSQRLDPPAGAA